MGSDFGKEAFLASVSWEQEILVILDTRGYNLIESLKDEGGQLPLLDFYDRPQGTLVIFEWYPLREGIWRDLTNEEWAFAQKGDLNSLFKIACPESYQQKTEELDIGIIYPMFKEITH